MKYNLDFNLMEIMGLVTACNNAINREHILFVRILRENGKAIRTLESVREKILTAISEDSYHVELDLMEMIQLYSACNMAWHYECAEKEKQHADYKLIQYSKAIQAIEDAREKILMALNK